MKTVTAHLKSISPYSQSRHYDTPKLEREIAKDYEARTWRERLHYTPEGKVYWRSRLRGEALPERPEGRRPKHPFPMQRQSNPLCPRDRRRRPLLVSVPQN